MIMLGIMSLCIVWRGAMALIIASMSLGLMSLFHLELGSPEVAASRAEMRVIGRGRQSVYVRAHVCVIQVMRGHSNGTDGFGRAFCDDSPFAYIFVP